MTPITKNAASIHPLVAEMLAADLQYGDTIQFKVVSNSMRPLILRGDRVTAEKVAYEQIRNGDIVLIQRSGDYLTHRLILKFPKRWLTKGDSNLLPDPSAPTDVIIGRIFKIQYGDDKYIDLRTRKWQMINPLLASLSRLEWKAFSIQRYLRYPFRLGIRAIQRFLIPQRKNYVDS